MAERRLIDQTMDLAVNILKHCEMIKGHYSLKNQIERSATSIGANIHEANYAHSRADFIAKFQIALKECYETEYWLELLMRSGILAEQDAKPLLHDCGNIRRMLIKSINTAKENLSNQS